MQVLVSLAQAQGQVVSKQELLRTVWADTVVVEMVLTRAISELRRVFQDKPTKPEYIETISKSGYRLIAPVTTQSRSTGFLLPKLVFPAIIALILISTVVGFLLPDPPQPVSTKPLTSAKGWEYHPALSSDGRILVYVGQDNNAHSNLFLRFLDVDSTVQLTTSNGFFLRPVWSPDDASIATFCKCDEGTGIYIFSVDDGALLDVLEIHTQYVGLSWSPAGKELAYVAFDSVSKRHTVFQYSFQSKSSKLQIKTMPASWGDSEPKYSPDGKSLAFVRTIAEGDQDMYHMNLATQTLQRLTHINRNILGYDWSGESSLIMASDLDGGQNLWRLKLSNTPATMEKIVKIPYGESIQNPTINQDLLVGEKWMQDTDLIIKSLDEKQSVDSMVLASSQWELHPSISPDGTSIAFSSNRTGFYEIWRLDLQTGSVHQLTTLENGFSGKPQWSPDSENIAFESNATGNHHIYTIRKDGSALSQITTEQGDYINPTWSRDGSVLYCASNIDGDWNIWAQSVLNGRLRKIPGPGGYFLQESPYHISRTFVTRLHQDGIWEIKMDGTEEKIIENLSSVDWGNWSVGRNGIHFIDRSSAMVSFYNFETGNTTQAFPISGNVPSNDPSFTYSEDHGMLLYGKLNSYSGDLIAIQNF